MTSDPLSRDPSRRLVRLLLGYLFAVDRPRWPGSDGVTVHEILFSYPLAARAGQVPDEVELIRRHPDLADEVRAFFTSSWRFPY